MYADVKIGECAIGQQFTSICKIEIGENEIGQQFTSMCKSELEQVQIGASTNCSDKKCHPILQHCTLMVNPSSFLHEKTMNNGLLQNRVSIFRKLKGFLGCSPTIRGGQKILFTLAQISIKLEFILMEINITII